MQNEQEIRLAQVLSKVRIELYRATEKFGPMKSPHEGYAILKEEVDELWDEIKSDNSLFSQRGEAIQIAAMAIRYILDVTGETE